ncbi:MAG: hypothetical protein RL238_2842 [Actinomycetota bacterium]|jgi:hypothetical protein
MDAFEDLVARLLRREHYWTRQNYKVELTKAEKVEIGLPSMPRPDIDILAYQPVTNSVLWVECKSYLDSGGVHYAAFDGSKPAFAKRFRVFTDPNYREIVTAALLRQLVADKLARPKPAIGYCLVAGRIASGQAAKVRGHFEAAGWDLRDRDWIRRTLHQLAGDAYEDDVVTMAAKLLAD